MNEAMMRLQFDYAWMFTNAKGRMPRDVHELREWLREFAKYETERADSTMKAYEDHVARTLNYTTFVFGRNNCKVKA